VHAPRLPLQDLALAPTSLKSYNKQLSSFLVFSRLSHQQFLSLPGSGLDHRMALFIQHLYDSHSSFAYASQALHGCVYQRQDVKQRMLQSRQCLRGWDRVRDRRSHPPLTWELTVLIAVVLSRSGFHAPAVAMLVGFDTYMRVSELTSILCCHITLPDDSRMGSIDAGITAVHLPKTKTGNDQSVEINNPDVAIILQRWALARACMVPLSVSRVRVFDFTPDFFRRLIRNAAVSLGVTTQYVPHSLRHGGATYDWLRTRSIEFVQFRGRWSSMESARLYIQQCRAKQAAVQVPEHLHRLGVVFGSALPFLFHHLHAAVPEIVPRTRGRRVTFTH
jgi:integrase